MSDLDTLKKTMRKDAGATRKAAFDAHPGAGAALAGHVMAGAGRLGLSDAPLTVSAFWPMGSEIDTRPLIEALAGAGHRIALPVVQAPRTPLVFRRWLPGEALVDGGFGTSIPGPDAPEAMPDLMFVPLLAYDTDGFRLGYGGGFYDRTLAARRTGGGIIPTAVGIAFSAQRVDSVPRGPHDQPLEWIATEAGLSALAPAADNEGNA